MKESLIQKQIIEYLSQIARRYNFFFFSIPNEGFMSAAIAAGMNKKTMAIMTNHFKKMGMVPGIPDLCILCNTTTEKIDYEAGPKTIFIEVKKPGEKPTPGQKLIHEAIRKLGHRVYVCVCVEGVERVLRWEGVIK